MPLSAQEQELVDQLPETGEILYTDFIDNLDANGKRSAQRNFHNLRRAGHISARNEKTDDGRLVLYVGRPVGGE